MLDFLCYWHCFSIVWFFLVMAFMPNYECLGPVYGFLSSDFHLVCAFIYGLKKREREKILSRQSIRYYRGMHFPTKYYFQDSALVIRLSSKDSPFTLFCQFSPYILLYHSAHVFSSQSGRRKHCCWAQLQLFHAHLSVLIDTAMCSSI